MTILRLAHLDAEGLVLDGAVRSLRDQFVTHNWSELLYRGLFFRGTRVSRELSRVRPATCSMQSLIPPKLIFLLIAIFLLEC
jgi:hypothetical protein